MLTILAPVAGDALSVVMAATRRQLAQAIDEGLEALVKSIKQRPRLRSAVGAGGAPGTWTPCPRTAAEWTMLLLD
jgi:hypothetical protein